MSLYWYEYADGDQRWMRSFSCRTMCIEQSVGCLLMTHATQWLREIN